MSESFIIDEWIWADLNGENGEKKQKEAMDFLFTLLKKCDKIAVAKGSKFQQKERNFSENASSDTKKHMIARFYFSTIKLDQRKYNEIEIEENEKINLEGINPDDSYLVKTYEKTKALIISTDNKLITNLKKYNIPCKSRDEFLKEYIKE